MKKFLCLFLCLIFALSLASCKGSPDASGNAETVSPNASGNAVNADASGNAEAESADVDYDPYAIIDYEKPIVNVGTDKIQIPKLDIYLPGANEVSDTMKSEIEADFADYDSVTYSFEVQLDTVQIIVAAEKDGKTVHRVYYYDALSDIQLELGDFISYCCISTQDILAGIAEKMNVEDVDEDVLDCMVYYGNNEYDFYCSDKHEAGDEQVYRLTVEKAEIDFSAIAEQIEGSEG